MNNFVLESFITYTKLYPVLMGFFKFFVLATLGELIGRKLQTGRWQLLGIHIGERALLWGLLGVLFTYIFPIYAGGIEQLVKDDRLILLSDGIGATISKAFWISFFMNMTFAFPMMVLHRFTDTLIDNRRLFSFWPVVDTWNQINWKNMWHDVAPTCIWFWIPAHTVTFSLPPEFRIVVAAMLSIALGIILSLKKRPKT